MPKAGGLAFALNAMSGRLNQLVDVTISYPDGIPSFWDFITGKVERVNVEVFVEEIDTALIGDYEDDAYKANFQQWLNNKWALKQQLLNKIK
jgi:1-acyl-sn-glycerol-3-phosphate acyltransferase